MRGLILGAAIVVLVAAGIDRAGAEPRSRFTSAYTRLDQTRCRIVAQGRDGEDWLIHRCTGFAGVPVWLGFVEGTRMRLGFGPKRNLTDAYAPEPLGPWPIEWRGRSGPGASRPFAVIVRVRRIEDAATVLAVFRLRPDGTSCRLAEATTNQAARRIADAASAAVHCDSEPDLD